MALCSRINTVELKANIPDMFKESKEIGRMLSG